MANGISTSSALDEKENAPTFVHTAPKNKPDAQAVVTFFRAIE